MLLSFITYCSFLFVALIITAHNDDQISISRSVNAETEGAGAMRLQTRYPSRIRRRSRSSDS